MSNDLREITERFYPRRHYFGGFTPPSKETEPMRTPEQEAYDRQLAEDRRENDRREALLTPPPDPEVEQLIAEQDARDTVRANADPEAMRRDLERRAGFESDGEWTGSSDEIRAKAKAAGWPGPARSAYLAAYDREQAARSVRSLDWTGEVH